MTKGNKGYEGAKTTLSKSEKHEKTQIHNNLKSWQLHRLLLLLLHDIGDPIRVCLLSVLVFSKTTASLFNNSSYNCISNIASLSFKVFEDSTYTNGKLMT